MAGKEVKVSVIAETKRFQAAWRRLGRESGLKDLKKNLRGIAKSATLAGAALTAAAGAGLAALAAFGADLEQSRGAVQDVFKESAAAALEFSSKATTALGLTSNAYNELATVLGSQLKNAGTPVSELANKTNDLISLGADLSAMFGGTTQDAVNALSSALKGERDPIERYGVSLKQAAIDAKAAELGFTKVAGSFDQEAQAAATIALIMEQTRDAHGKFAREGATLAHQMQVWKAVIVDLGQRIAEKFAPILGKLSQFIFDKVNPAIESLLAWLDAEGTSAIESFATSMYQRIMPALSTAAQWISTYLLPALRTLASFITGTVIPGFVSLAQFIWKNRDILTAASAILVFVGAWKAWTTALQIWRSLQIAATAAQIAWNIALSLNPVVIVVGALIAFAAALYVLYQRSETVRNAVNFVWESMKAAAQPVVEWFQATLMPALSSLWDSLQEMFTALWSSTGSAWESYGRPIFDAIMIVVNGIAANWDAIWAGIQQTVSGVWQIISSIVLAAVNTIKGIIDIFTGLLTGDWDKVWSGIKTVFQAQWDGIKGVLSGAFDFIAGIFNTYLAVLKGAWSAAWKHVSSFISNAWTGITSTISSGISRAINLIKSLPSKALNVLSNLGSTLWNAGTSLIQGFIDGITSKIAGVKETLSGLTNLLPDWKGPESLDRVLLTNAGEQVINGFIRGLESRYGAVKASLAGLTTSIGETRIAPNPAIARPLHSTSTGGITINVHCLTPTVETGRIIADALAQFHSLNGARS